VQHEYSTAEQIYHQWKLVGTAQGSEDYGDHRIFCFVDDWRARGLETSTQTKLLMWAIREALYAQTNLWIRGTWLVREDGRGLHQLPDPQALDRLDLINFSTPLLSSIEEELLGY
jgi:hypothetical protein